MLESIQATNYSFNLSQTKSEIPPIKWLSKNDIGYNEEMDLNNDEEITIGEFREYCNENNIAGEGKNKLMKIMLNSNLIEEIAQKNEEIQQRKEIEENFKNEPIEDESKKETDEKSESINTLAYKNAYKAYSQF